MKLTSLSFVDGARIPDVYAYGNPATSAHVRPGANRNPHLAWSDVPVGTRSFVLICHDPDVPSRKDDVNQEGRGVPADLPRVDFFHWVLVDLAANLREIGEGVFSDGITAGGKPGPTAPLGTRQGVNTYGSSNHGYDGPCPPWNDALLHHYVFTLYALDLASCPVEGERFGGAEVRAAIERHVLAQASLTGTYSLNPAVR
ncbi:MAG: YbhB/YbcL family Raf kinase inhibitor-like protein [Azoarcus sp.]|nr:YbhB/YbcL family Raf kinase inhibitor-like protein [Azoarcus sp.]